MEIMNMSELIVEKAPEIVGKDKQEIISDIMFELGMKYTKVCFDKNSIKESKIAFKLAKEAFSMVLQAEPVKVTDVTVEFIKLVENRTPRSELWLYYLEWCSLRNVGPVSKKIFFGLVEASGFTFKKTDGHFLALKDGARRK